MIIWAASITDVSASRVASISTTLAVVRARTHRRGTKQWSDIEQSTLADDLPMLAPRAKSFTLTTGLRQAHASHADVGTLF